MSPRKVTILQHRLLHYRLTLFERLRGACARNDIELNLVHGQASPQEELKKDTGAISWATPVRNRFLNVAGRDLLWQPFPEALRNSELVIVMQENRILSNYPLILQRYMRSSTKVAFWGHGCNFQSRAPHGLRETWKRALLTKVDWWFAYTELTAQMLKVAGFPESRTTVLNNAIDTKGFQQDLECVTEAMITELRSCLDLAEDAPLGLYCGSLYSDKRLEFLIDAADIIHREIPSFRLAIVGSGPSLAELLPLLSNRPWIVHLGVRRGVEKAACFKLANVILNPGAVGLHILDAFVSGVPLFTTTSALHGPEIVYLAHGINGYNLPPVVKEYADCVLACIKGPALATRLGKAGRDSANYFTLDSMVKRFSDGIIHCLARS